MKILLIPLESRRGPITYRFAGDIITATIGGITDTFDFTGFGDGKLQAFDEETGEELIETELPINPIRSAERKDGVLYIELINYIGLDATEKERFPEWIDHTEYVAPEPIKEETAEEPVVKEGEVSG